MLSCLRGRGYLAASVDTAQGRSYIKRGDVFYWDSVYYDSILSTRLEKLSKLPGRRVRFKQLGAWLDDIVADAANYGFPFFSLTPEPCFSSESTFFLRIKADNYTSPVFIDTLLIPNNELVSPRYLSALLGIKKGDLYSHKAVGEIEAKLSQLSFATLNGPAACSFTTRGAVVEVPIQTRISGSFGGIVGFASSAAAGRMVLTGDVNLALENAFHRGESLTAQWSKDAVESQTVSLSTTLPYLFGAPAGFGASFHLQKRDTTSLEVNGKVEGQFYFNSFHRVKAGAEWRVNQLISASSDSFPDSRATLYQIGVAGARYDNAIRPTCGFMYEFVAGTGVRSAMMSDGDIQSPMFEFSGNCRRIFKFSERFFFTLSLSGGLLFAGDSLSRLEAFKVGGINSLRGFDERSLFATRYFLAETEFAYRIDLESDIFITSQFFPYRLEVSGANVRSEICSLGAGARIGAGGGVVTVVYALGMRRGLPVRLRDAKLHLGYNVLF